jgi:hypothetical protein
MSSTERSAFFQAYVPDLFKAQQAKLEQDAAYRRAVAGGGGGDGSLMYNNPSDVFQSYFLGTPTQPKSPPRVVPMGAPVQSAPPRAVPVSRGLNMNNMGFGQQEVISPW